MNDWKDHSYRQRPYFRNLGIICTLLFAFAWLGSVLATYFNVDGSVARPGLAIVFFSIIYGSTTLLGVWLILRYFKFQLVLANDAVRQVGVTHTKNILVHKIQELKWRTRPKGGSCVVISVDSTLTIEFDQFTQAERKEIIGYLRGYLADDCQIGWDAFRDCFINPSPEKIRRQRSLERILMLAIFAFAAAFAIAWLSGLGTQYLGFSILNVAVGVISIRRSRRSQVTASDKPG